ncbi:MAG: hypothetical protein Q7U10_01650 [Thermodesulfovibrionia bacterium]|nr:hypothetical protein [Thermodesulfovibrionia bacterium]
MNSGIAKNGLDISDRKIRSIRFAVMCRGTSFTAWEADCLQKLLSLPNVEIALLIIDDNTSKAYGNLRKFKILWSLYWRFLVMFRSRAYRCVDMSSALSQVPSIRCMTLSNGKQPQSFKSSDISEIRQYDLDFILRFGFDFVCGEILEAPRYGIWSFHHGDEEKYRGCPPAFWEIYHGDNVTGAVLQRLTGRFDAGIILRKGFFRTLTTSYVNNLDEVLFQTSGWPAQVCIDIQNGTAGYFDAPPSGTFASVQNNPGNLQMGLFFIRIAGNFFKKMFRYLFCDQWNIGIVDSPIHDFLTPDFTPEIKWLPVSSDRNFVADPFGIKYAGQIHILFEELDYRSTKGHISSASFNGLDFSSANTVINEPFHMSYPYLIEYKGGIYCIPETGAAGEVALYAFEEFPFRWKKAATLIRNFSGLDSTVFQYDGLWWLFATDQNDGFNYKLKIWHADDLFGPWQPHANNPVKMDIRSSRPAGTPFFYNGYLYRPVQDCSHTYGGQICFNRILRLTASEFREETAVAVEPFKNTPYPDGLHTISAVGDMTLIDAKRKVFIVKNLSMMVYKIKDIFSKLKGN